MERRIVGKRVWLEIDGQRLRGTLTSENDVSVVVREDRHRGVAVFPKRLEGERWGLLEDEGRPKAS